MIVLGDSFLVGVGKLPAQGLIPWQATCLPCCVVWLGQVSSHKIKGEREGVINESAVLDKVDGLFGGASNTRRAYPACPVT